MFGHAEAGRAKSAAGHETPDQLADEDRLLKGPLFKSAVIIVALTASSLQSDRHEALAAGCNDFLTKVSPYTPPIICCLILNAQPVNFVWLERKVKEWGCMQALIDFDGWRKWKDYGNAPGAGPGKMKGGAGAATAAPESSGHGSQKDARPSAASATNSSFEGGKTLSTTSLKNDTSDSKEDSS